MTDTDLASESPARGSVFDKLRSSVFSPAPGGGGSLVGISWLPPVFGIVFALQLVRMGLGPVTGGRAVGRAVLGLAATAIAVFAVMKLGLMRPGPPNATSLFLFTASLAIGAAIAWSGWPTFGRTLLAYAFAARIPVAVLMLVAMMGNWGTHYDVAPPNVSGALGLSAMRFTVRDIGAARPFMAGARDYKSRLVIRPEAAMGAVLLFEKSTE